MVRPFDELQGDLEKLTQNLFHVLHHASGAR